MAAVKKELLRDVDGAADVEKIKCGHHLPPLYTPNGWVNTDLFFSDPAPIVVALGGRGIGKTFGVLRACAEGRAGQFFYLRRTQTQIDACRLPELNPFKAVNASTGSAVIPAALGKFAMGFYRAEEKDGRMVPAGPTIGIGAALSVFANLRGVDGSDLDTLVFDEFLKERHERPIAHEGEAFLNAYETLNRNRELEGRPPLKAILLGNSNDLAAPILHDLGLVREIDRMTRKGLERGRAAGGMVSIYRFQNSPVSALKAQTAVYQLGNRDFAEMALKNFFSEENYENVERRPLSENRPLCCLDGVTIFEHKNNGTFLVVPGQRAPERYRALPNDLAAFRRRYWYVLNAATDRRLFFSTAEAKIVFESAVLRRG